MRMSDLLFDGSVESSRVEMLGLADCVRVTNGVVDLVAATRMGPRILRYGYADGPNLLGEFPDAKVETPWGPWRPLAGHRLWVAPEIMPGSYAPDDVPVDVDTTDRALRLRGRPDATGISKEMSIALDPDGTGVTVVHRLRNHGAWPVEMSAWALTILRGGGYVLVPQEPFGPHPEFLQPARPMVLWRFTDLADPRWKLGSRWIRLHADPSRTEPQKVGVGNRRGWAAYLGEDTLFVKRFPWVEGAPYPDMGCNTETFTAGAFVEVESLSPLARVEPGGVLEHVERWELERADGRALDDAAMDALVERIDGLS